MQKPPRLPEPPHKNAAFALIAAAFLVGLVIALLLSIGSPLAEVDTFGRVFLSILVLIFLCSSLGGTLLLLRKKAGLIFAWICVPMIFLSFPIGTAIAIYVAIQVSKRETRDALT